MRKEKRMRDHHSGHRRVIASLIIIGLTATSRRDSAAPAKALDLVLIDTTHTASLSLIAAAHEVQTIWAAAGWRVSVTAPAEARRSDSDRLLVPTVIRQIVGRPRVSSPSEHGHSGGRTMAWLGLDANGCPASAIEVSLGQVTSAVMSAEYVGHDVRTLPAFVRETLLGRALGRVIAHEIGHWLFGSEHANAGLMKPVLTPDDLVKLVPPPLPDAWTSRIDSEVRSERRCRALPMDHVKPAAEFGVRLQPRYLQAGNAAAALRALLSVDRHDKGIVVRIAWSYDFEHRLQHDQTKDLEVVLIDQIQIVVRSRQYDRVMRALVQVDQRHTHLLASFRRDQGREPGIVVPALEVDAQTNLRA
jgi:hypothetical protein